MQYRVDQRKIALQQGGKIHLCSPRHHHLQPQLRPRHPNEQAPACCLVELVEVHLRQHDAHGALAFEPMHGLDQELALGPHRFPVGRVSPQKLPKHKHPQLRLLQQE